METFNTTSSYGQPKQPIIPPTTGTSHLNVGGTERVASLLGGVLLTYFGLRKPNAGGLMMAAAGGAMLFRGATGYCPLNSALGRDSSTGTGAALEITRSLTIHKPRHEVYQFWRQLENLPKFMHHLQEVRQFGPKRSHWVATVPKGLGTVAWDADIVEEEENTRLVWRSLPDSDIDNAGEVRFSDAPDGGTIVQATISYRPPVGQLGGSVAKLLNPKLEQMVAEDLHRFKALMETGEAIREESQPLG
ncbi:DUF2892 domain-containing protein [Pontibacter sp. E15-1]|uniref:SRPBCC family protein n=1 Tax=Pontibacter sp. E15-1 TaxID=2919918 RepID=UPI001F50321D|nr:SRPBCC family protein [Pontibacter sp. E15-1]MCJ8166689.1 DUF2892 domain-containing protein [Pontibacter sp. E15-1]